MLNLFNFVREELGVIGFPEAYPVLTETSKMERFVTVYGF